MFQLLTNISLPIITAIYMYRRYKLSHRIVAMVILLPSLFLQSCNRFLKQNNQLQLEINLPKGFSNIYRENLLEEWEIWSKCFGRAVIINGISSSGKTTVSSYLKRRGYRIISFDQILEENLFLYFRQIIPKEYLLAQKFIPGDDIKKLFYDCKINREKYSPSLLPVLQIVEYSIKLINKHIPIYTDFDINELLYKKAQEYLFSGLNIAIDIVAENRDLEHLSYCFNYYPLYTVLVYSPLRRSLKNCFIRNQLSYKNDLYDFRDPYWIIVQYLNFYQILPQEEFNHRKYKYIDIIDQSSIKTNLMKSYEKARKFFPLPINENKEEATLNVTQFYTVNELVEAFKKNSIVVSKVNFEQIIYNHSIIKLEKDTNDLL